MLVWEGYTDWGNGDNPGCKSLQLKTAKRASMGPCGSPLEAKEIFAGIEQEWADIQHRFASFTYKSATDRLVFRGKGKLGGPAWQRAIVAWAHSIYGALSSGRRSATGRNVLEWWLNEVPERPGQCGLLVVRESGDATASVFPCGQFGGTTGEDFSAWLTTREWNVFDQWLYHRAELESGDNNFAGKGKRQMKQQERTALSRWATAVFTRLLRQKSDRTNDREQDVASRDDYAVYAALLAEYDDRETSPHDGTTSKLLVLENSTFGPVEGTCAPATVFQRQRQTMTPAWQAAVADYQAKNKAPQTLSRSFHLRHPYTLLEQKEVQLFMADGATRIWDKLRAQYPNAPALITFSRAGFNEARTRAVVYRTTRCGLLCGDHSYFVLAKEGGAWTIVKTLNCLKS